MSQEAERRIIKALKEGNIVTCEGCGTKRPLSRYKPAENPSEPPLHYCPDCVEGIEHLLIPYQEWKESKE